MSLTPEEQKELAQLRQLKAQTQPQPQPTAEQKPGMSALETAGTALYNLPRSTYELGKSTVQALTSPIETGKAIVNLGGSVLSKLGVTNASPDLANQVGEFYKNRYGSIEKAKQTFAQDPAGFLADASTVLTGGGAALRAVPQVMGRTGGAISRAGQAVSRAADIVDPLSVVGRGVGAAGTTAATLAGFTTGAGGRAFKEAAKAGYQGGEQAEAFRSQMRGTAPVNAVIETVKPAVDALRQQRSQAYKAGMAGVTKDKTILKFDDIDATVNKVRNRGFFEGKSKDPAAASAWQELSTVIDDWKKGDPAVYHTVEGIDALKQAVGSIRDSLPYGTPARNAANEVYSAVRGEITRQAPGYSRVMSDYETASDLLQEIEKTLSLNPKANIDTQVRKLQSILRNNANTNYGRRVELGEILAEQGAPNLFPQLAGQALSSATPRGLSGALTGAGALYNVGQTIGAGLSPVGLASLAIASPRVMGEATYFAGRAAGAPQRLATLLAKHGKKLANQSPKLAMGVDQASRLLSQGKKVDPKLARLLAYQLGQFERATEQQKQQ